MTSQRQSGLSGSALKIIAILAMTVDHAAIMLARRVPGMGDTVMTVLGQEFNPYQLMRLVGRLAFPIFAFLIAEGAAHTRNRLKYDASLLIAALLSEPFFDMFNRFQTLEFTEQNVFFTLFLGYTAICLAEKFKHRTWLAISTTAAMMLTAHLLKTDYGAAGVACIYLVHLLGSSYGTFRFLSFLLLPKPGAAALAGIPIMFYNGERGFIRKKWMKYAFYAYYPLHLLILTLLSVKP